MTHFVWFAGFLIKHFMCNPGLYRIKLNHKKSIMKLSESLKTTSKVEAYYHCARCNKDVKE